jgi:N-acetyl-anhydromuramyl-L-alanine amidase AmpD
VIETDRWTFVQARWYTKTADGVRRKVRVIVIHVMEFYERATAAEEIARDFATRPESNKGSAHVCVDNNSIVQCVRDNDVAYAAPGCNNDGIQIELAGYGKQTRDQWLDDYGMQLLALAAEATAQYCLKYDLPPKHLTDDELRAGDTGIVGHAQASAVYKKSDHTDPGVNFPWDVFMGMVDERFEQRKARLGVA